MSCQYNSDPMYLLSIYSPAIYNEAGSVNDVSLVGICLFGSCCSWFCVFPVTLHFLHGFPTSLVLPVFLLCVTVCMAMFIPGNTINLGRSSQKWTARDTHVSNVVKVCLS